MIRLPRPFAAFVAAAALVAACSAGATPSPSVTPAPSGPPATSGPPASLELSDCPTTGPEPMAGGETRVVTIETSEGPIEISVEADLGPLAAQNFVDLASCGYYDGVVFHRVVPGFVIQGGDGEFGRIDSYNSQAVGSGGPGYAFADDPVDVPYERGVVAMANSGPATNGSQFFIVLEDSGLDPAYSVFGRVTSGMDAVDAIAAAADAQKPSDPIVMDRVTVAQP